MTREENAPSVKQVLLIIIQSLFVSLIITRCINRKITLNDRRNDVDYKYTFFTQFDFW